MGKAQSKRSVDITTEVPTKEEVIQEGTGKLEKIDDKYFKENESSVSFYIIPISFSLFLLSKESASKRET